VEPAVNLNELIRQGEIIRPDELAKCLKVSQAAVYQWCARGTIPYFRIGKVIRFNAEDIGEWLKAKRVAAVKAPAGGPA
jgi:excisionase family DNA binding protein